MSKKFSLMLVPLLALACNALVPPRQVPPSPEPVATEEVSTPTKSVPQDAPTESVDHVVTRLYQSGGDLNTQLAEHAQKAADLGLIPVLEFDATWCPPCQAVAASIEEENPLMMKALKGVYLIRADADVWGWDNENLSFEAIPVYFKLDADGQPTGDQIDGGAWDRDIPENFAPVLNEFFHQ
ncbi:MAG: hypothetical protein HYZ25_15055 [Chloroflexi bacterium]|nr:hypothetical protein [Chloroflexota bacterium]